MNKTISIALAGFSFIIEEQAYIKLNDYLEALRKSLKEEEVEEVMYDIEIRVAEIFKSSMKAREVVNMEDVEGVIAQIGTPEIIEEQEEAYYSENMEKNYSKSQSYGQKQLFRDPSKGKISGVCAGLAQYMGIDITIMRVIWVIMFIISGFFPVVFIYIVLWIVMPEAITASDFLKMQGKPINFDSLKDAGQRIGNFYNENKSQISQRGTDIWNVMRKVLGWIMALVAVTLLLSLLIVLFMLLGSNIGTVRMNDVLRSEFDFIFDNNEMFYILVAIVFVAILIPTFISTALSIKLFSPKTKIRYWGAVVGILFAILGGLAGYLAVNEPRKEILYSGYNTAEERVEVMAQENTIRIDIRKIDIPSNFKVYNDDIFSDKKRVFKENDPDVYIRRKEVDKSYLVIKKQADGYNVPMEVEVPVKLVGNTILLPNYIEYPYKHRFRDYDVKYELVVPYNMEVVSLNGDRIDLRGDSIFDFEPYQEDYDEDEAVNQPSEAAPTERKS